MISGVLLDLAGVIYEGERALPGALDAVDRLRHVGAKKKPQEANGGYASLAGLLRVPGGEPSDGEGKTHHT